MTSLIIRQHTLDIITSKLLVTIQGREPMNLQLI